MFKLLFLFFGGFSSFNISAQIDSMFILKGKVYFSNEDFDYSDSSLHGRLCWYSNVLYENNEIVLFNLSTENTVYRFTHINRLGNGSCFRLEKNDSTYTLFLAHNSETIEKKLSLSQARKFEKKLKSCHFWEMSTRIERKGFDGSQWIFEGIKDSNYHVVDRWSPKKRSRYRKMCMYIMLISPLLHPIPSLH